MKISITIKESGEEYIIRKAVFRDDGKVAAKYGLDKEGNWVLVPEGTMYPPECRFPKIWRR